MEQVLNLETQEFIEGLEELPCRDDDNFSSDNERTSLMDEEEAETISSNEGNERNTNWEIDDVDGIEEE